jgi:hypothetical protein
VGDNASQIGDQPEQSAKNIVDETENTTEKTTAGTGTGGILNDNVDGTGVAQLLEQIRGDFRVLAKTESCARYQACPKKKLTAQKFHMPR